MEKDRPSFFLTRRQSRKQLRLLRQRHKQNQLLIAKKLNGNRALKCAFLSAFSECGNIALSCRACGITKFGKIKAWRKYDKAFNKFYVQAEEFAIANLENEARRRAIHGTARVVTYKGQPVYIPEDLFDPDSKLVPLIEKQYSDELLKLLLRGHMPAKYGSQVDISVGGSNLAYKQIKQIKGVSVDDL